MGNAVFQNGAHGGMGSHARHCIFYALMKRLMDIIVSGALIVALSPFGLLIALLIKLDTKGPVFYRQRRCGLGGREFWMYKLRTMVVNADDLKKTLRNEVDGPMFKVSHDPRITRVGQWLRKWSLDEFPQLFNVFRGEMSLVGPRPLAAEEMTKNPEWRDLRLTVVPGMTGLWQIRARHTKKFEDWVKYDTEYVRNHGLAMDIKLLVMTFFAVLGRKGAE